MMKNNPNGLINSIIFMMAEREKVRKAKRVNGKYLGLDPDLTIHSADYYIKANLWLIQSLNQDINGEILVN